MKVLHLLIVIPLLVAAAWIIYGAESALEGISFAWSPQNCVNTKLVLVLFLLFGYIMGRIGAWFGYATLRAELRKQRKANKALNKEQAKLNQTVSGLKQDIIGLQEKALKEIVAPVAAEKSAVSEWWRKLKSNKTEKGA